MSLKIHGIVLVVALITAYFVWTREPSTESEDEISIVSFSDLDKVIYEEEERSVEITRKKDDKGDYYWVHVEKMEAKAQPRPKFPPRPPMPPKPGMGRAPTPPGAALKPSAPSGKMPPKGLPAKLGRPPVKVAPKAMPRLKVRPKTLAPKRLPKPKLTPKSKNSLARDPKAVPKKAPAKVPAKLLSKKPPAKKAPPKAAPPPSPAKKAPAKGLPTKNPFATKGPATKGPAKNFFPVPPKGKMKKPKVEKVKKEQDFKGNKAAGELVKKLANFKAFRVLTVIDDKRRKAFGLADSKKSLVLVSGSTRRVFVIGDKTYGNSDYYIEDKAAKRVYIIKPQVLQDLKYAEYRLLDRDLVDFDKSDIDRAKVITKDGTKVVTQHNRRDTKGAFWNKEGGAKKRNDLYQTWMGKVLGLRAVKYVDETIKAADLEQVVKIEFSLGDRKKGELAIYKSKAAPVPLAGDKAPTPAKESFFAKSDNTRVHVELAKARADEIVRDLDTIIKD